MSGRRAAHVLFGLVSLASVGELLEIRNCMVRGRRTTIDVLKLRSQRCPDQIVDASRPFAPGLLLFTTC